MRIIKGGTYVPLYGDKTEKTIVSDFYLDVFPVTNHDFLIFLEQNPKWRKSEVKRLFADENYLIDWQADMEIGRTINALSPVTNVSWFAAKAYCECEGKRLPTMDEWEYAAMANESLIDARKKESFNKYILSWYETPRSYENPIGKTMKNIWGIYDLHGLVWEWVYDFNSVIITGESRSDVDLDRNLFCAGGAVGATDLMNYAAFMRYAFRGSIRANYTVKNLGFRCAKDSGGS
ncbi:MAG: formylglycine-generating enzyme family protein [Calditrichaeota bacterium]|nr:formylglycine-generating enzyme family protein [Calditrichota bacterium]